MKKQFKRSELKNLIRLVIKESVSMKTDSEFNDGVNGTMAAVNIGETSSKPMYLRDTGVQLDDKEKELIIKSINTFSEGGHAAPDINNVMQFGYKFVLLVLRKAEKFLLGKPKSTNDLNDVKKLIQKLSSQQIKEMSTTGGVAGYSTPFAFTKNKNGSPKGIAAAKKYGKVVGETPRV